MKDNAQERFEPGLFEELELEEPKGPGQSHQPLAQELLELLELVEVGVKSVKWFRFQIQVPVPKSQALEQISVEFQGLVDLWRKWSYKYNKLWEALRSELSHLQHLQHLHGYNSKRNEICCFAPHALNRVEPVLLHCWKSRKMRYKMIQDFESRQ